MKILEYKTVELSIVTDHDIEEAINKTVRKGGWTLDGIHFAMRDSSKRPAMAFILFTRQAEVPDEDPDEDTDENAPPVIN